MDTDTEPQEATADLAGAMAEADNPQGVIRALTSYIWKNVFPIMILGIFGVGTSSQLGMSSDVSDAHERVSEVQFENAYRMTSIEADIAWKFKWAQEVIARSAAEDASIRKLLEAAQISLGIMQYRLDRLERGVGNQGPVFDPPDVGDPEGEAKPAAPQPDYDELMRRIKEQINKRPRINPEDIDRYLHEQRPVQAPNLPRPVRRGERKK